MRRFLLVFTGLFIATIGAWAHVGDHPSIHDVVAGIVSRFTKTMTHEQLTGLTVDQALEALTPEERDILANHHISFRVNQSVTLYVMRDERLGEEPYWLKERNFERTGMKVMVGRRPFDVWKKNFDPGAIGLGVNSLSGGGDHYFVAMKPLQSGATIEVTEVYPAVHTTGILEKGTSAFGDGETAITEIPADLEGAVLLRGAYAKRRDAQLVNLFRYTEYPASDRPDHIVLTWSDDPKTTQAIQWRTSENVHKGAVAYIKKADFKTVNPGKPVIVAAQTEKLETPNVVNNPVVNRHTAVLLGLEPETTYLYAVGDGTEKGWTEYNEFTTAPEGIEPFSFVYMGDAQNGLERWGTLVHNAYNKRPDAAFYIMAGDLVNRGAERDDWDMFFENAQGVFDKRQLVPVLGNHEYQGGEPELYLKQFKLPEHGPKEIAPEKAYWFNYSNALFVVLDSNLPAETQAPWLDDILANSTATWKFVCYHHPAYSSGPERDNPEVRKIWGSIFDKYHVDLALQGHDHAYLRTYPMKGEQRVGSAAEGTIYIVSVSGTKFYDQGDFDYKEFGLTNISLYHTLDIQIMGDRLVYKAFDIDGNLKDEFVIEK
ncbi:MAG: hypothetical protein AMXMBFR84_06120 [Candidatus Hydrogenedentota bacterium]